MFNEGDSYIRYSVEGISKGIVRTVRYSHIIDILNRVTYIKEQIISENGETLDLDGTNGNIYKVTSTISEERARDLYDSISSYQKS